MKTCDLSTFYKISKLILVLIFSVIIVSLIRHNFYQMILISAILLQLWIAVAIGNFIDLIYAFKAFIDSFNLKYIYDNKVNIMSSLFIFSQLFIMLSIAAVGIINMLYNKWSFNDLSSLVLMIPSFYEETAKDGRFYLEKLKEYLVLLVVPSILFILLLYNLTIIDWGMDSINESFTFLIALFLFLIEGKQLFRDKGKLKP